MMKGLEHLSKIPDLIKTIADLTETGSERMSEHRQSLDTMTAELRKLRELAERNEKHIPRLLEIGQNLSEQLHFLNQIVLAVAEKTSDPSAKIGELFSSGLKAFMSRVRPK